MVVRSFCGIGLIAVLLLPTVVTRAEAPLPLSPVPQSPMGLSVATTPNTVAVRYTTTTGSTLLAEATTVNVSYTGVGLTLDLTGGTLTSSDGQAQSFRTLRLSFTGTDLQEMRLANQ